MIYLASCPLYLIICERSQYSENTYKGNDCYLGTDTGRKRGHDLIKILYSASYYVEWQWFR